MSDEKGTEEKGTGKSGAKKLARRNRRVRKRYKIQGSDLRFKGKTHKQGSVITLTDAEYKEVTKVIKLTLQKEVKKNG